MRNVSMAEIDSERLSEDEVEELRARERNLALWGGQPSPRLADLRARRSRAEALLALWWAQGCREVA